MSITIWDWYEQNVSERPLCRGLILPLAFGLGMTGQYILGHGAAENWLLGVILYIVSACLVVLVMWRKNYLWGISTGSRGLRGGMPSVRRMTAILGVALGIVTYTGVAGNRFTLIGVLAWAGSVVIWIYASWQFSVLGPRIAKKRILQRRHTLIIMVAILVIGAAFRFAKLNDIPVEMTSDHVEKLLDVAKIVDGERPVFLPTNGGREPMQAYTAALAVGWLGMPTRHLTLKLIMSLAGFITIPLVYVFGLVVSGNRRVSLLAALLFAVGWWPVVISRNGLRFPLAPLFATLTLYFIIRGLTRGHHNICLLGGLVLGLGFYGYTPFRIMPLVVVVLYGIYIVHDRCRDGRGYAVRQVLMVGVIAASGVLPLFRYSIDEPEAFWHRTVTRVGEAENEHVTGVARLLLGNAWDSVRMFARTSDAAWLVSPTGQPVLDWVTSALFHLGLVFVFLRYCRKRSWLDLFLIVCIPLMLLPSTLALAFPVENPSVTRAGMAQPIVFLVAAMALDVIMRYIERGLGGRVGAIVSISVAMILMAVVVRLNQRITFDAYARQYALSAENASELGQEVRGFADTLGSWETVWVVAYPHWVDTRAVGIYAERFGWNNVILGDQENHLQSTLSDKGNKLFILNNNDIAMQELLWKIYPDGMLRRRLSRISPDKDFLLFSVTGEL